MLGSGYYTPTERAAATAHFLQGSCGLLAAVGLARSRVQVVELQVVTTH